jgi:hypothetical protein
LQAFYGQGGFVPAAEEDVPQFLRERVISYGARGLNTLVMRRS